MKKIVLNIADSTYEKLRFESIREKKSIQDVIRDRIFQMPFHDTVEDAFQSWMEQEVETIIKG